VVSLRERVGEAFHAQYLALSSGDDESAQAFHRLDVGLRDALRPELEFLEIAMRSRYHDAMMACRPGKPVWLLDPSLPVRGLLTRSASVEFGRLEAGLQSPGQTVNRLSFSFWGQLTARWLEKVLWVPYLHRAYGKEPLGGRCMERLRMSSGYATACTITRLYSNSRCGGTWIRSIGCSISSCPNWARSVVTPASCLPSSIS
jgi:hypothetical protein